MLLMQDAPGLEMSSRFEQGRAQSATILHIEVREDILDADLGWGDTGTDESGPGMVNASVSLNTQPLLGNRTTLSYSQTNDYREYWSFRADESWQLASGLTFGASYMNSDSPEMDSDFTRELTTKPTVPP